MKKLSDERLNVANGISKETLVTQIKESDPVRFDQMLIEEEERKSYYFVKYNSVAIDRKPLTLKFPLFKDLVSDFEQNIETSGGIKILKNEQIVNKVTAKGYTPFNTPKYSNQNLVFDELEIFFENNNVKKTQPLFYLPNETERHTCGTCDGDKYTTCTEHECHGQHTYDCSKCDASGSVDCDDCKGHGEKKCPSCSGTGSIKCKGYVSSGGTSGPASNAVYSCSNGIATCSNCFGKGCFHCKHKGKTTCPTCNGAGKNPCSKKYNSNYGIGKLFDTIGGVEFCEGSGKIDCKSCGSKGQVRCKKCQGDGRIDCKICYGDYTDNRYGKVDCITCETAGELASISYVSTSILAKKDEYILTDGNEIQAPDFSMNLIKNHVTKEIEPELFYKNINGDFADTHDKYSEFCSNKIQKKIGIQRNSYPKLIKEEMSYECVPCATYSYSHILTATLHDVSILGIDKKQDVLFHSNPTDVAEEKESFKEKVKELCRKAFSTKTYKDKIDRKHEMFLMVHMAKADGVIEEQEKRYLAQTITGLHGFTNKEKGELFGLMSVSTLPMISPLNAYFSSEERAKDAKQKIVELVAKADGEYEPEEKSKLDEINNAIEAGFKAKPSWIGQFFKTWQVSVSIFIILSLISFILYFSLVLLPIKNATALHLNLLENQKKLEYFLSPNEKKNIAIKDTIFDIVEAEDMLNNLNHNSDLKFLFEGKEISYIDYWRLQKTKLLSLFKEYEISHPQNNTSQKTTNSEIVIDRKQFLGTFSYDGKGALESFYIIVSLSKNHLEFEYNQGGQGYSPYFIELSTEINKNNDYVFKASSNESGKETFTFHKNKTTGKYEIKTSSPIDGNQIIFSFNQQPDEGSNEYDESKGGPAGDIVVGVNDKIYFYDESNYNSKTNFYFVKGQEAEYFEVSDDNPDDEFLYVNFTDNNGETIAGYVLKSDVRFE